MLFHAITNKQQVSSPVASQNSENGMQEKVKSIASNRLLMKARYYVLINLCHRHIIPVITIITTI